MHYDYGYIEEGKLGRVYDTKLLKRFFKYVIKFKKPCVYIVLINIISIIFDLIPPYLTKIVIDDVILPNYILVDSTGLSSDLREEILTKSKFHLILENRELFILTHKTYQNLSPQAIKHLQINKSITDQRYFLINTKEQMFEYDLKLSDTEYLVSKSRIGSITPKHLLKIRSKDISFIFQICLIFLAFVMIAFFIGYKEHIVLEYITQNIILNLRTELVQKIFARQIKFFETNSAGKLVTRVTNDIENLNEMFKSVFATLIKDIILVMGIFLVIFFLNKKVGFILLAAIPIVLGIALRFSTMAREVFRELRITVSKINTFLQERLAGIKVIKIFVQENSQFNEFKIINEHNYNVGMKQIKVFAVFMPIMELLSSFCVAILIYLGGVDIISNHMTLGALVALINYTQMLFKPVRDLSEKYNIMQAGMASLERIFELMDINLQEKPGTKLVLEPKGHIVFKDVSFSYNQKDLVLKEVSFDVPPFRTLAIVGPTGAGKTTIINLLEGFYEPDQGEIIIDEIGLSEWDKKALRSQMGICTQDVILFSGTVLENITLGRALDTSQIDKILKISGAQYLIQRLPHGLNSFVGQGGRMLSSGERQLISFARAIASDPKILILDEATSSVDPQTELIMQEGIRGILRERTSIIVAHRLSTIKEADEILVLRDGRIIERGDHEELMEKKGFYHELVQLLSMGLL